MSKYHAVRTDVSLLEKQNERLRAEADKQTGENVREFRGDGDRQYLTGLKLGGKRILVLLDRSASMLDHSLVNVIRMRNMPEPVQRRAAKWQRAVATVDWLSSQFPRDSEYQIVLFNTRAEPALADSAGKWLKVSERKQLDTAVASLRSVTPAEGTSLAAAFAAAAAKISGSRSAGTTQGHSKRRPPAASRSADGGNGSPANNETSERIAALSTVDTSIRITSTGSSLPTGRYC